MFESIILGIIQGLTEFIPVSSSAHLIIVPWLFNWRGTVDTLSFTVALHLGTLIALLYYFRGEWIELLRGIKRRDGMIWYIMVGTLPAAFAGFLLHDMAEHLRNPLLIAFTLSSVAVLMLLSERLKRGRTLGEITLLDALTIGVAQSLALVPGVSRSGITIVAGLARGFHREASTRFSFLLSAPIIAGAGMLEAKDLFQSGMVDIDIFLTGTLVAAITGYIAIKYMLYFVQRYPLNLFAYYRFLLAFVIIILAIYGKN